MASAVLSEKIQSVEFFFAKNIPNLVAEDLNFSSGQGTSALEMAIRVVFPEAVDILFQNGGFKPNRRAQIIDSILHFERNDFDQHARVLEILPRYGFTLTPDERQQILTGA